MSEKISKISTNHGVCQEFWTLTGNRVQIERRDATTWGGAYVQYDAAIAADGTVTGSSKVAATGATGPFHATLHCDGSVKTDGPNDIGLNGCWNQCSIHIYQNRDGSIFFSSAWKNPLDCKDCAVRGWVLSRGKGQIIGQDVHLYDQVSATLIKKADGTFASDQPQSGNLEYFLKLSADGNTLDGYYGYKDKPSGYVTWRRDK
jgi:hypothetical protein